MNDISMRPGFASAVPPKALRVAVLVDGDNVPYSSQGLIEKTGLDLGDVVIRRVYADFAMRKDWSVATEFLSVHCPTTAGKNRADIQLVIGALDIAFRGLAQAFAIVSDDRDFGPLVAHLREMGMLVAWVGKPKKPPAEAVPLPVVVPKATPLSALDQKLRDRIRAHPSAGKCISLVTLGNLMTVQKQTVKAMTGHATWRAYLSTHPELYLLEGTGAAGTVRLR